VSGFDHRSLDERQGNWHEFLYPYRLANYRKRALASPAVIGMIDYRENEVKPIHHLTEIPFEINGTCDGIAIWVDYVLYEEAPQSVQQYALETQGQLTQHITQQSSNVHNHGYNNSQHPSLASFPSFASQSDVPLTKNSHSRLSHYCHNEFPPYMTQSIKFLETSESVSLGNKLVAEIYFESGQSEFQHRFEIVR
jgi:hypothetical protein